MITIVNREVKELAQSHTAGIQTQEAWTLAYHTPVLEPHATHQRGDPLLSPILRCEAEEFCKSESSVCCVGV